jgi:hypothetical protein
MSSDIPKKYARRLPSQENINIDAIHPLMCNARAKASEKRLFETHRMPSYHDPACPCPMSKIFRGHVPPIGTDVPK